MVAIIRCAAFDTSSPSFNSNRGLTRSLDCALSRGVRGVRGVLPDPRDPADRADDDRGDSIDDAVLLSATGRPSPSRSWSDARPRPGTPCGGPGAFGGRAEASVDAGAAACGAGGGGYEGAAAAAKCELPAACTEAYGPSPSPVARTRAGSGAGGTYDSTLPKDAPTNSVTLNGPTHSIQRHYGFNPKPLNHNVSGWCVWGIFGSSFWDNIITTIKRFLAPGALPIALPEDAVAD